MRGLLHTKQSKTGPISSPNTSQEAQTSKDYNEGYIVCLIESSVARQMMLSLKAQRTRQELIHTQSYLNSFSGII